MAGRAVRSFEDSARAAFREPDARDMSTSRDWEHMDYWYDRHLEATSPAARTANPSELALIAFAVTTILLQVAIHNLQPCSCTALYILCMSAHAAAACTALR